MSNRKRTCIYKNRALFSFTVSADGKTASCFPWLPSIPHCSDVILLIFLANSWRKSLLLDFSSSVLLPVVAIDPEAKLEPIYTIRGKSLIDTLYIRVLLMPSVCTLKGVRTRSRRVKRNKKNRQISSFKRL